MGAGLRPSLRHPARAGRAGARARARRAVRHRLAGHPAAAREGAARPRQCVRAAAVDPRSREAAADQGARQRRGDPRPHGQGRRRDEPLGRVRLRGDQPRDRGGVRTGARHPRRRAAQARAPDRPLRLRTWAAVRAVGGVLLRTLGRALARPNTFDTARCWVS